MLDPTQILKTIAAMEKRMYLHAKNLEFEDAARLRDEIRQLKDQLLTASSRGVK